MINFNSRVTLLFTHLIVLMGLLATTCLAQTPQVSIEIIKVEDCDKIKLNWQAVDGAESYHIYSSNEPYPDNWGEAISTVGNDVTEYVTEESIDNLGNQCFFHITAFIPPNLPDWLILVDGDAFGDHQVAINPFYISKYEVTQAEFVEIMGEWEFGYPNNLTHPAENVKWFDSIEYCNRLSIQKGLHPVYSYNGRDNPDDWYDQFPGWNENENNHSNVLCNWEANGYRLPTEAEWVHAANSGINPQPYTYAGSDDLNEVAWHRDNSGGTTHPVGTKAPNELGIFDMTGNVFEYCWDIWGAPWPPVVDNPQGANEGTVRVKRGGTHGVLPIIVCPLSNRFNSNAIYRSRWDGFRICRIIP